MLRMLSQNEGTKKGRDRGGAVPRDPLNRKGSTVAELFNSFGITLHVEFGNDDVFEFDGYVLEITALSGWRGTMVAQTLSSRLSELALT